MKENQKELFNQKDTTNYSERKILVGKIVLTIILGFNMFKMVCQIFNLNLPCINTFIDILEDSNFFFNSSMYFFYICCDICQTVLNIIIYSKYNRYCHD